MAANLSRTRHRSTSRQRREITLAAEQLEVRSMLAGDTITEAPALLKDINVGFYGSNPSYLTESFNYIYFAAASADGNALWRTDGTEANTTIVKSFPNANLTFTDNLVAANGTLYFFVRDNFNVVSLWKSNGTETGTTMVTELDYGPTAVPSNPVIAGGQLYFFMDDGVHGRELWTSNGTAAGTKLVKDINGTSSTSLNYSPETPVAVGNTIYFTANDGSTGYQLWSSDGTEEGTQMVLDSGSYGFSPGRMLEFNDALYFFAYDSNQRYTLWRSDGTAAGTQQVSDVSVRSSFSTLVEFHNEIYFTGGGSLNGGWELWKSDGTIGNAVQVTDINPGNLSSNVTKVTPAGDTLFFVADDGTHGEELWTSDGSVGNATMAADILINGLYPPPWTSNLVAAKNEDAVYFTIVQDDVGRELWRSDGTSEGTYLVVDLYPGVADSNPAEITAINNKVVFSATDATYGKELRVATIGLPLNQAPNVQIGGPYFGLEGGTVQLDASGTTDDRNAPEELSYQWDLDEDGEFDDAVGATPIMSLANLGGPDVIEVSVKVTDLDGAATVRSITLAIENVPPILTIAETSVNADQGSVPLNGGTYADVPADIVTLSASLGTIVDNMDGTWSWSWDSTGHAAGFQVVTITAADGATLTQKTFDLTINNLPPLIQVDSDSVTLQPGTTAINGGAYSDPDDVVTITASFGTVGQDDQTGLWSWSYDVPTGRVNSQKVTITATDSHDATASVTFDLIGNNAPPTVHIGGPYYSVNGGTILLDAGGTTDDVDALQDLAFAWDLDGDSQYDDATGATPQFLLSGYAVDDEVPIAVRVTDKEGGTSYATGYVTIVAAAVVNPPPGDVVVDEGSAVSINGTMERGTAISASVGTATLIDAEHWSWSFGATDGPAQSQTVTITVLGYGGVPTEMTFALVVNNAAPTVGVDHASVAVAEGITAANSGTFADLGGDAVTITTSVGAILQDDQAGTWTWSAAGLSGPADSQTITITATDADGGESTVTFALDVTNVAPTIAADVATYVTTAGKTAIVTGVYNDPGDDLLSFSASIGMVTDNHDGTWTWTLPNVALGGDGQTVTITADDGDGGSDQTTFDLTVLPPASAYLTLNNGPATTDASGEATMLPEDLLAINEWNEFTVNVWAMLGDQYVNDLTGVSLSLNYNRDWFQLKNFAPSSGVGQLTVANTGDALQITASQLASGDLASGAYLLIGSFRFQPNPAGGVVNNSDDGYPAPVDDLQFALADVQLTLDAYGDVPGQQIGSPATLMQVVTYDTDDDGTISLLDMTNVIRRLGSPVAGNQAALNSNGSFAATTNNYRFDFDQDGTVTLLDLTYLIRNLGLGAGNGNQLRFPPLPTQTTNFSSPLSSSFVSTGPTLEGEAIQSTTATSVSQLEGEAAPAASLEAENVDAAFGNLAALTDCWEPPTAEAEAASDQVIADVRDNWQLFPIPDWALQAATARDTFWEKANSSLDELIEEHPRLGVLADWFESQLEQL